MALKNRYVRQDGGPGSGRHPEGGPKKAPAAEEHQAPPAVAKAEEASNAAHEATHKAAEAHKEAAGAHHEAAKAHHAAGNHAHAKEHEKKGEKHEAISNNLLLDLLKAGAP